MASIPLVSGGSQPVFATDTLNGPQLSANTAYAPAGTPTNFMGPKLDFFGVSLDASNILTTVAVTGVAGQMSATATTFTVNQSVVVSGIETGTQTGIVPGTYYIIATNGTTTFQLSATKGGAGVTTTAGTSTLTYDAGVGDSLFNQAQVNGAVQLVLQTIQQTSTVAIYQVDNTNNGVNFSLALYPTAAYTPATLQAAIQGLGTVNGVDLSASVVTNVGFRLASTATLAS